jgi:hypothetical protein
MATKQTPRQKKVVGRVMHEFKHGELARGRGGKVKKPKQAIAIALSEAGASNQQSPGENRRRLRRTETREQQSGPTRGELYQRAQKADIPGRSRMSKDELQRALTQH